MRGQNMICKQRRTSCRFNEGGCCIILNDTNFRKGRKCPFYKPKEIKEKKRRYY